MQVHLKATHQPKIEIADEKHFMHLDKAIFLKLMFTFIKTHTSQQRKLQSKTFEYDILPIQKTRSLFPQFRGLSNCPKRNNITRWYYQEIKNIILKDQITQRLK